MGKPKTANYLYAVQPQEIQEADLLNQFKTTKLGKTSQKQCAKKLTQWIQYIPEKTLTALITQPDASLKYLESASIKHSPSNHHIFISALIGYLTHVYPTSPHLDKWKRIQKSNSEPLTEHYLDNKPTELQKDKQIRYEELIRTLNALEKGSFERLLIAFYTLIEPIRADYYATEIITDNDHPTEENYIVVSETIATLYVNDFKTKQRYEAIKNTLSSHLYEELKESLKKYPRKYLFVMEDNKPFTRKLFSNWACRTLTRVLKQPMTLTALRHTFITYKRSMNTTKDELKEMAKNMGHSRGMQQAYEWISGM